MKDVFRTLATNLHILLVSVALVAMGVGALQVPPQNRSNNNNGSNGTLNFSMAPQPETSRSTDNSGSGDNTQADSQENDPENTPEDSPKDTSETPEDMLNNLGSDSADDTNATPAIHSEPFRSPATNFCSQCSTEYCLRYCKPSVPSLGAPGPIAGCGVCGGSAGDPTSASAGRAIQVMCPTYCPATGQ